MMKTNYIMLKHYNVNGKLDPACTYDMPKDKYAKTTKNNYSHFVIFNHFGIKKKKQNKTMTQFAEEVPCYLKHFIHQTSYW